MKNKPLLLLAAAALAAAAGAQATTTTQTGKARRLASRPAGAGDAGTGEVARLTLA